MKRAKLGDFCSISDDNAIQYWNTEIDGATRINRNINESSNMFSTRYMCSGQIFDAYIFVEDEEIQNLIINSLNRVLWIGADRYAGFGRCKIVNEISVIDYYPASQIYGFNNEEEVLSENICMLAVSPFTMCDNNGSVIGINEKELANKLGVESVKISICSTTVSEYGGFNRKWKCRVPNVRMYDSGSIFKLKCEGIPPLDNIKKIINEGIGIRKNEGFGQVIFIPLKLLENTKEKKNYDCHSSENSIAKKVRLAKLNWIENMLYDSGLEKLSKSQIGAIQSICEKAALMSDTNIIEKYLEKNAQNRTIHFAKKYEGVKLLIEEVCQKPLYETLELSEDVCKDSMKGRIELISKLFNHRRKIVERDEVK